MYSVCCAGTPAQIYAGIQLLEVADGGGGGGDMRKKGRGRSMQYYYMASNNTMLSGRH